MHQVGYRCRVCSTATTHDYMQLRESLFKKENLVLKILVGRHRILRGFAFIIKFSGDPASVMLTHCSSAARKNGKMRPTLASETFHL